MSPMEFFLSAHGSGSLTRMVSTLRIVNKDRPHSFFDLILHFNFIFRRLGQGICLLLDHGFLPTYSQSHSKQSSFRNFESCRFHCRSSTNLKTRIYWIFTERERKEKHAHVAYAIFRIKHIMCCCYFICQV